MALALAMGGAPLYRQMHVTQVCCGRPCCCGEDPWDDEAEGWRYEMPNSYICPKIGLGVVVPIGIALVATGAVMVRKEPLLTGRATLTSPGIGGLAQISKSTDYVPMMSMGALLTFASLAMSLTVCSLRSYQSVRGRGERAKLWSVQTVNCNQVASEVRLAAVRRVYVAPGATISTCCGVTVRQGTLLGLVETLSGDSEAPGETVLVPQMLASLQVPRGDDAIEALGRQFAEAISTATGRPCFAGPPDGPFAPSSTASPAPLPSAVPFGSDASSKSFNTFDSAPAPPAAPAPYSGTSATLML
jgi:hypothetical protein